MTEESARNFTRKWHTKNEQFFYILLHSLNAKLKGRDEKGVTGKKRETSGKISLRLLTMSQQMLWFSQRAVRIHQSRFATSWHSAARSWIRSLPILFQYKTQFNPAQHILDFASVAAASNISWQLQFIHFCCKSSKLPSTITHKFCFERCRTLSCNEFNTSIKTTCTQLHLLLLRARVELKPSPPTPTTLNKDTSLFMTTMITLRTSLLIM